MGSSPRMRGAPVLRLSSSVYRRIIPADAGSTALTDSGLIADEDHPRGCGEHIARNLTMTCEQGSSPRMRGALGLRRNHIVVRGIIPADAGSTWSQDSCQVHPKDHPRGCGEHAVPARHGTPAMGSSPRMRGAHSDNGSDRVSFRIIPADAGSTWQSLV